MIIIYFIQNNYKSSITTISVSVFLWFESVISGVGTRSEFVLLISFVHAVKHMKHIKV